MGIWGEPAEKDSWLALGPARAEPVSIEKPGRTGDLLFPNSKGELLARLRGFEGYVNRKSFKINAGA